MTTEKNATNSKVTPTVKRNSSTQMLLVAVLVIAAMFGAYRFAQASNFTGATASNGVVSNATQASSKVSGASAAGASSGAAGADGCCGTGGGSSTPVKGAATVEGTVQKISVDVQGTYSPNVIELKAGVPAEITFGQSSGCTAVVESADLGFSEDLTSGPRTVKIAGLKAGTYGFACGMNMVQGQIVVK